ncbi:MAG: hypothetical protein U9N10_09955, partial [Bacillota bacterium]|nr:hypothetical protein [Bacillota bacterium]
MTKKITFLILLVLIFVVVSGCSQEKTLSLEDEFKETTSNEFIFDKPGIYGDTDIRKEFKGTIYIKTDGVTLQNVNITGDLIITEEVAEGDVELIDLNISNTVYVYGGGENSIRFRRTKSKHTLVYKPRKPVRIVIDKESKIDAITVQSSAILEGDSFSSVSIKPKEENIDINLIGIFKKIEIKGQTHIATSEKTYIENIVINEQAKKTIITGDGNILNMEVNAENINIDIPVDNVYTNNNINKVVINNKETNLIIEPEEIYHTADTWEIGMPWDPEWGDEPDGVWQPNSGIPWKPEWGDEPDNLDIPENEP